MASKIELLEGFGHLRAAAPAADAPPVEPVPNDRSLVSTKVPEQEVLMPVRFATSSRKELAKARSELGKTFTENLLADFRVHGVDAIEHVRMKHPDKYLRLVADSLPRQTEELGNPLQDMENDEIENLRTSLEGIIGRIRAISGEGDG